MKKDGRAHRPGMLPMVQIQLPDGSVKEFPEGVRPREVAASIGKRLAEAAVAAVTDGTIVDLSTGRSRMGGHRRSPSAS